MVYIPMNRSAAEVLAALEAHVQRLNGHEEALRQREERIHQCEKEVQRREAELMCIDKEHTRSEELAHKELNLKRIETVLKSRAVEIEKKEGELKAKEAHLALRETELKAEEDKEAVRATENGLGEGLKPRVTPAVKKRVRPVKTGPVGTANAPSMEPMAQVAAEVAISSRAPLARTMNFRQMSESLTEEEEVVSAKKIKSAGTKGAKRTRNTAKRRPQRFSGYRLYKIAKLAELAAQSIHPPRAFSAVAAGWKELVAADRSEWDTRAKDKNNQRDAEMVGAEDGKNERSDE